jgi:hypothetical protein
MRGPGGMPGPGMRAGRGGLVLVALLAGSLGAASCAPASAPASVTASMALSFRAPTCPVPGDAPEAVYRAFWDAGRSPADPEVACFMSEGSLAELEALRAEDREMAEALLEFMAAMHTDLHQAAVVGPVELREATDAGVTLRIGFKGRGGSLPERFQSTTATVEMVREAGTWKIHRQSFASSVRGPFED